MALYDFKLGSESGGVAGLTNVEDILGGMQPMAPSSFFSPYSDLVQLGDGTISGQGWSTAEWRFDFLSKAQRNALKAFCPGKSKVVFIRTIKDDGNYANYKAVMIWPDEEKWFAQRITEFVLRFQRLEVQA